MNTGYVALLAWTAVFGHVSFSRAYGSAAAPAYVKRDGSAVQPAALDARLRAFLARSGTAVDTVLAVKDSFIAAVIRPHRGRRLLLTYREHGDRFDPIVPRLDIDSLGVYPTVEMVAISDSDVNTVAYEFDGAVEGVAWSVIYSRTGGRWLQTYEDSQATCRPAVLRNVDGTWLLLRFTGYPEPLDCSAMCEMYVREDLDMEPAWVDVLSWDNGAWRAADDKHPGFYRRLAAGYASAAAAVQRPGLEACAPEGRASEMHARLARFARMARALAVQHRRSGIDQSAGLQSIRITVLPRGSRGTDARQRFVQYPLGLSVTP